MRDRSALDVTISLPRDGGNLTHETARQVTIKVGAVELVIQDDWRAGELVVVRRKDGDFAKDGSPYHIAFSEKTGRIVREVSIDGEGHNVTVVHDAETGKITHDGRPLWKRMVQAVCPSW